MRVSSFLVIGLAAVLGADAAAAQTGAVATSTRMAAPGGTIRGGIGSATGAPTAVHIGRMPNCSSRDCVTTSLLDANISPDLFYEKTRLLGNNQQTTLALKLCVFDGGSASRCPAGGDVTYNVNHRTTANLSDLSMINFGRLPEVPGCFVLRWESPKLFSTPFAIIASSDAGFPCAGR